MRLRPVFAILSLMIGLASGCSDVPPLDPEMSAAVRAADYPALVPIEQVTGRAPPDRIAAGDVEDLETRRAQLLSRAAGHRGGGIDPETRSRLRSGVQQ